MRRRCVPALDQLRAAHRRNDNVGSSHGLGDVLRARVRDGDRGVALHQQQGDGDAHHVGATDDHGLLALDRHTAAVQQLNAALERVIYAAVECSKQI